MLVGGTQIKAQALKFSNEMKIQDLPSSQLQQLKAHERIFFEFCITSKNLENQLN